MRAIGPGLAAVLAALSLLVPAPALADRSGEETADGPTTAAGGSSVAERSVGSEGGSPGTSPATPGTDGRPADRTVQPETVVTDLEDELMCPVCGTLLGLADAPQAHRQRAMIERLAERGYSKQEIKDVMVDEFGEQVLPMPEPSGFNLSAYIVPIAGIPIALIALAVAILRWRRQNRPDARSADAAPAEASGSADAPSANDAPGERPTPEAEGSEAERRLDADLDRYDL